jgi:sugar O-acyltransferase (sialic acid O-acetyltransferase NeuD family)
MSRKLVGVYGASGFGREVMPLVRSQFAADLAAGSATLVFIDDNASNRSVNGHAVISFAEFCSIDVVTKLVGIAIADGGIRRKLVLKCLEMGIEPLRIVASSALFLDENVIGEGAIFCPYTMVTSNVRIGKYFHCNIYSYVAHDCVIGDFVTFAPGVKCNGNVHIENYAYVGTGAILRQGKADAPLVVGEGAVIGMGAVVTKSVAPGTTVVGNPARLMG